MCACAPHTPVEDRISIDLVFHVIDDVTTHERFLSEQISELNRVLADSVFRVASSDIVVHVDPAWRNYGGDNTRECEKIAEVSNEVDVFVVESIKPPEVIVGKCECDIITKIYRRYLVIIDDEAKPGTTHPTTLGHEIGHLYGLTHNFSDEKNIMKSGDRNLDSSFSAGQLTSMAKHARRFSLARLFGS